MVGRRPAVWAGPALALLAAAAGCAHRAAGDRIAFSHRRHPGVECSECHAGMAAAADHRPGQARCGNCHDVADRSACRMCHSRPDAPRAWPASTRSELIFAHRPHVARANRACARCHPGGEEGPAARPPMATCLGCHPHRDWFRKLACRQCHSRLATLRPASSFAHEAGFERRHGELARPVAEVCAQCHDQTFCGQCHDRLAPVGPAIRFPERIEREFIHTGDFVTRHAVEASAGPAACQRCHGPPFCAACHEREGVGAQTSARSPHPGRWQEADDPSSHGRAARANPTACAACHDQGARSICVPCHRAGGSAGISPHPIDWENRVRARFGDATRARELPNCRVCHP